MTDNETLDAYWRARREADRVWRERNYGTIICSRETAALVEAAQGEDREIPKAQLVVEGRATWAVA